MASAFEKRSVRRKFFYFGFILLLFTGSLLHRKLVIDVQANDLMMREVGKGKADVVDSAFRLTLSGARGVAVTSLWLTAIEKQKHHQWNELEVAVDSLTRLQPRFISPWVYQGWNLAFNVSVECDRVRDKYYYITRGIALLCRGEEKNDPGQATPPQPWPANPDLRFEIANTYHRKIGHGDESKSLRCLFDLSCMPPSERDADQFYIAGPRGKQIDLEKFKAFCERHPRFVRRLRDRLIGFDRPEAVVQFIADSKHIPGRIEVRTKLEKGQRLDEFPILPPLDQKAAEMYPDPYPDWRSETLGGATEDFDVFVCMRAWHTYAQVPLPPPNIDGLDVPWDRVRYRLPRFTTIIWRSYPARSQAFVAEELQKDGWFDDAGWRISGWFDTLTQKPIVIVGAGTKYHSGSAWNRAYEWYRLYGLRNGMYLEPADMKKLLEDAAKLGPTSFPGRKLLANDSNRQRTRFDEFFRQIKVERTAEAVAARKATFEAEHIHRGNPNVFNLYYTKVLPQWLDLLLRYPEFRALADVQEESYKIQADYFWAFQKSNREWLPSLVKEALCAVPTWPLPGMLPPLPMDAEAKIAKDWPLAFMAKVAQKETIKVLPIRDVEGLFDQLFVLDDPQGEGEKLKPLALALARSVLWPPPPSEPGAQDFAFTRFVVWPPVGPGPGPPEIGLGLQAAWPLAKGYLSPGSVGAFAGSAAAASWPAPTFLMLSSAEDRRILTTIGGHGIPPAGEGWIPLIQLDAFLRARRAVAWMQPPGR